MTVSERLRQLDPPQRAALAARLGLGSAGTRVLTAFVAGENLPAEEELRGFVARQLPRYMLPRRIEVLGQLPRNDNGKVDRAVLRATPPSAPAVRGEVATNDIEQQLIAIWREVLAQQRVGRADDFFDLGGDSLRAMSLFSAIEKTFDKSLPLATIFERPTIAELAEIIRPRANPGDHPGLVVLQQGEGLTPLFCMHCGTGNVFHYRELARLLGKQRPVFGLVPAGLDGQSGFHASVIDMARHYVDLIVSACPQGPYLLCGYSFGGTVAYEVARRLHESGREVAFTGLFDTGVYGTLSLGTGLPDYQQRLRQLGPMQKLAQLSRSAYGHVRSLVRDSWRRLQRQCQLLPARILLALGRPIPVRLQPIHLRELFSRAMLDYVPQPYAGKVNLYRQQSGVWEWRDQPDMGWGKFVAPGNLRLHDLPGEHGDMLEPPLVESLAEAIREEIQTY